MTTYRISISTLLSTVIALIVLVAVGTMFAISTISARVNLLQGLAQEYDLIIATIEERVDDHLAPIAAQLTFLEELIVDDPDLLVDRTRLAKTLRTSIAAAPQVSAIALSRPDASSIRYERLEDRFFFDDLTDRADILIELDEALNRGPDGADLGWSEPLYSPNIGRTIIVLREAVWIDGEFQGLLLAGVDLFALSRYADEVATSIGQTVFLLHGRDRVLAHPKLLKIPSELSVDRPLLNIDEVQDPRLAAIWRDDRNPIISRGFMKKSDGHYFFANGFWQVFVYSELEGFGRTPWLVGFHFDTSDGASEVRRFWVLSAIGLGIVALFTALAYVVGRKLSRPFEVLTDNAQALQRLDFEALKPMSGSRILELDKTATAFDRMVRGLRVFERYVPGRVVERIVRDGHSEIAPAERDVTVLFTDIAGFSELAENLTPQETAELLNAHFGLVGACIDEQDGTIDKYTGDGLIAFWGAPDRQEDHADRACRAALAIRQAVMRDNALRREHGARPIRLRIGVHTGRVLVGDIGARSRINYTVIGDAVNVASRVETAGRHHSESEVAILVTDQTLAACRDMFDTEPIGATALEGRAAPVMLHKLLG